MAQKAKQNTTAPADNEGATQALSSQVGLGVDIVEIERIRAILARTPRFKETVYTADERAYCEKSSSPEIHYATRFAAKEAVLKALGTGFSQGIGPQDVEVCRTSKGRPYTVLHGAAREEAQRQGVTEVPLSLSYTHTEAVACAMALTAESALPAEPQDPMAELSRQFKELRGMLDEMDGADDKGTGTLSSPEQERVEL